MVAPSLFCPGLAGSLHSAVLGFRHPAGADSPHETNPTPNYHPMKMTLLSLNRPLAAAALMLLCALALPDTSSAKPDKGHGKKQDRSSSYRDQRSSGDRDHNRDRDQRSGGDRDHDHDHDRVKYYNSRPRSTFTLNLGTGYAGRGYYYGPANVPYYYQRSDVRYYSTREAAPREYYSRDGYRGLSVGASVQQALARQGYYRGGIDGQLGPYSRRSIARYQADHGLRPTGMINSSLLRSLRLQ